MTENLNLTAQLKDMSGKGNARALRRDGKVPAIIYGNHEEPQMAALSLKEFNKEYQKGGIKTRLVNLIVDDKPVTAITKAIQFHPVSDNPIHVDFLRVGKDTVIKLAIAIKVLNEDKAPGIKRGGVLNLVHRTIEFYCHPSNIPSFIEVDVANLEIGNNIHISDVKLPEGISAVDKTNFTVLSITSRVEEKAATETVAAEGATDAATPAAATPASK